MKTNFKNIMLLLVLGLVMQSFTLPSVHAEKLGKWKILGITTVKKALDRDEVKVKIAQGRLGSIKIKVKGAPLEMKRFEVHFRNGQKQTIKIRKNFSKDSESRVINLKGNKRLIKKVVFWYSKKRFIGKVPVVILMGK